MKKLMTLLFTGITALLTACSSYSSMSSLPIEIYNHTSQTIDFNMTNVTEKDWKGWELGYGGGIKSVAAFSSETGGGGLWRLPNKWDPNYTILVQWASNGEVYTNPKRTFVKLPSYEMNGLVALHIHFLSDRSIKIFVSNENPDYPNYPYGWPQDDDPKRKNKIGKRHMKI
ncbi:MAG: DUF3304 domain-containing protein [Neisseria sp.]|jgi:lipoprotein|uniref:DUF3304 domain-containing protein n=1 Tax=Neisseria sp. TaxID=192066 RepID=UPI001CAD9DBB|nr:DUF3304 domain-containing protein [Neisseria sp.]MBF1278223.1 DUF3304 domain-containing protein [Neisseria sp.]